ncbi:SRPBCC family protein [Mycobacterium simiae]|uniref:SRPBCC family protein n=1 Tax=Mycobacterium simiae TaxID=1784 RepID=A0A5B1BRF2_MYCSI|nr:SRPBCC family protein [Mycobacterium simiae]KAA1250632.1 SRPBCC family protein [Mycobacterium simiae]
MVEIHVARTIAAPIEQVFDLLADPNVLTAAPLVLRAGWAKDSSPPGAGAVREVIGIGIWFLEAITAFDRPGSYSYLIVRSFPPFNHHGGTLTFSVSGNSTHVDWLSSYTHPARAGGKVLESVTRPLLRSSFLAVLAGCAATLEGRDGCSRGRH